MFPCIHVSDSSDDTYVGRNGTFFTSTPVGVLAILKKEWPSHPKGKAFRVLLENGNAITHNAVLAQELKAIRQGGRKISVFPAGLSADWTPWNGEEIPLCDGIRIQ